jgi:hypothetical protein
VTASSFPEGVTAAHEKLRALAPARSERRYFGISHPDEKGVIIYKAAAEELEPGELSKQGLEKFVIPNGDYACIVIKDYLKDPSQIGKAFDTILHNAPYDPKGFCLEWYTGDRDVRCMVRLRS